MVYITQVALSFFFGTIIIVLIIEHRNGLRLTKNIILLCHSPPAFFFLSLWISSNSNFF